MRALRFGSILAGVLALGIGWCRTPARATGVAPSLVVVDRDAFGGGGGLIRVDPTTGAQSVISSGGFVDPLKVAVTANGDLLVTDRHAHGGNGVVFLVDPATGAKSIFSDGGAISSPTGIVVEANGGIAVVDSGSVVRLDPLTGAQTVLSSGGYLAGPFDLTVGSNGNFYVLDQALAGSRGGVVEVDRVTGAQTLIVQGLPLDAPTGIATEADGHLVITCSSGQNVVRVDPVVHTMSTLSSRGLLSTPLGAGVLPDGSIAVADFGDDSGTTAHDGKIALLNPATGAQTLLASSGLLENPADVRAVSLRPRPTLVPGDLLVTDVHAFSTDNKAGDRDGGVLKVDPLTGAQSVVSAGGMFKDPKGIAWGKDGQIYVADANAFGGSGGVIRVDPATGAQSSVSSGGNFVNPDGIAVLPNGDLLVVDTSARGTGAVIRVNPSTGAQDVQTSGGFFHAPSHLAFAPDGNWLVTDVGAFGNAGVVRVNPVTGEQSEFQDLMNNPAGIAVTPAGRVLVVDTLAGAVYQTGVPSPLPVISSGGFFNLPAGIAVASDDSLYVADYEYRTYGAILRINATTHQQEVVSSFGYFNQPYDVAIVPTPNQAPVAVGDRYSGWQNCPLTVGAPGVLGNDTDADGNPLSAVLLQGPTGGSLTLSSGGGFTYTPYAGTASDSFTYRAFDGTSYSSAATVTLALTADPVKPTVVFGSTVTQTSPTRVYLPATVADSQSGVVRVEATANSANCTLSAGGQSGNVLTFAPAVSSSVIQVVKLDPTRSARVELKVTDCAGNVTLADPVLAELEIPAGAQSVSQTFAGIPEAEHFLAAQNGRPGVRMLDIRVNGASNGVLALGPGSGGKRNLAHQMRAGNDNTVTVIAYGRPGGRVQLTIGDESVTGAPHGRAGTPPSVPGLNRDWGSR